MPKEQDLQIRLVQNTVDLWDLPLVAAGCATCGQAHLIPEESLGTICPGCGKSQMELQPAQLRPEPPELVLPFAIKSAQIIEDLSEFTRKVWPSPDDFTIKNLQSRLRPAYLPLWLVDCDINGTWKAEAGFDYQVKSSQESFQNGNWNTEEIIKTRVQWEPRAGTIARKYNNLAVPALADYTQYIKKLGKFRLNDAVRYNKEALENSFVRIPDLSPENAWPLAQDNLNRIAQKECQEAVAADHFRNYSVHTGYTNPNWTQLLLPTYFTYYTDDDGSPVPIYIHGQTGKIAGPRLASQRKGWKWAGISVLIALGLFLITLLFIAGSALLPVLSILALVPGVFAFIAAIFAVIPAVYPWQWNRRQQDKIIVMISNQDQPDLYIK